MKIILAAVLTMGLFVGGVDACGFNSVRIQRNSVRVQRVFVPSIIQVQRVRITQRVRVNQRFKVNQRVRSRSVSNFRQVQFVEPVFQSAFLQQKGCGSFLIR